MTNHEPFMSPEPPYHHPGPPHAHHPHEPHHHPHFHPWGDVLASGECDDQLPLFSHVGRGLKGDSFRVDLREPTDYETYLDGVSIDSNTGFETPEWTTSNLNAGVLTEEKVTDPNDLKPYYTDEEIAEMLPANMHGYLIQYFKDPGDDPTWTEFIGPIPDDIIGYELNIEDTQVDKDGVPLDDGEFIIHAWTTKPDGDREYDPTYPDYYTDYWSPTLKTDDTEDLTRIPVYDVIIKNPDESDWEPDEITTETEWADPTYDHPGTQRKNTYPDSWDPDKIAGLPQPGDAGIVTIEVGPHKDIDVYTTPQVDSATGYGDEIPGLIPLPSDYEGSDHKPYAWDSVPLGWNGTPIQYITNYQQGDHNPGSTNYSPTIAAYDQARFDDLHAGIEANKSAIAAWAQAAVNNWVDMPFAISWPSKYMTDKFSNRSKINKDLGLVYLDMDWELDSNMSYTAGNVLASCEVSDLYQSSGTSAKHLIGNIGHRIHEYTNTNVPPQYYNDFPVTCEIVMKSGVRVLQLSCAWGFQNTYGGADNTVRYLHIVGTIPLAVIDTTLAPSH